MLTLCALAGPAVAPQPAAAGQKSTDWKMAFSDAIDFQSNIFASFDSTPYFIFTEVYDTAPELQREAPARRTS